MSSVLERLDRWGCKAFQTDEEWAELRQAIIDGEEAQRLRVEVAGYVKEDAIKASVNKTLLDEVERLQELLKNLLKAHDERTAWFSEAIWDRVRAELKESKE